MKGVQPRKTLDFIGFSVFASGGALKCTRDFGQLEFLTAPTVRTLRFWKSPVIGQMIFRSPYISDKEVCKGYSRGMPRPSDRWLIGTPNLRQPVS